MYEATFLLLHTFSSHGAKQAQGNLYFNLLQIFIRIITFNTIIMLPVPRDANEIQFTSTIYGALGIHYCTLVLSGKIWSAFALCRNRLYLQHSPLRLPAISQDHHPSKNSVQKTTCYNWTSNAPDDGRMYPKYVELRIH